MSILFHYASTRDEPQHHFCPVGETSWCKWQADKASGTNNYRLLKNPLSSALVEVLKPVFEKLSSLQLLQGAEKCLIKNENESLHHVIWSYLPKGEYYSPSETELGTALAIEHFNDGTYSFNSKLHQSENWKCQQTVLEDHCDMLHINSDNIKHRKKRFKINGGFQT